MPDQLQVDPDIPPFQRKSPQGSRERVQWMADRIDRRIERLAELGLRPYPDLIAYRRELGGQLAEGGPYLLRHRSGRY